MPESPILDECKSLLKELERVEKCLSSLADSMISASAASENGSHSEIEGLIDAHSEAEEDFAALRKRIVDLARSYGLCPHGAPEQGYSPSGLRGLLQGLQRTEQGFKQPAPEPLFSTDDSPWEHIPSDLLASIDLPEQRASDLAAAASQPASAENLPSDVELFLNRVISEANHAVLKNTTLSEATDALPPTAVSRIREISARQEIKEKKEKQLSPALQDSPQPQQLSIPKPQVTRPPEASAKVPAGPWAPAEKHTAPAHAPLPPPAPTQAAVPTAVVEAAWAAEQQAAREAAAGPTVPTPSERDYQELLEYGEGKLGLGRAEFADLLANLALLNHKQGRLDDAEELHRKELMIREHELGPDHPKVATSLNNLALLCRDRGNHTEAMRLWERSLAIVEAAFGSDHPKVALRLGNLADLLHQCGETSKAELYYQRLLALRESGTAGSRREVKSSLRRYAELLRSTRRKKEAGEVESHIVTPRPRWFRNWR